MSAPASASKPSRIHLLSALGTRYAVWGSTYLAIAVVVEELPRLMPAGTHFLLAAALHGVLLVLMRHR